MPMLLACFWLIPAPCMHTIQYYDTVSPTQGHYLLKKRYNTVECFIQDHQQQQKSTTLSKSSFNLCNMSLWTTQSLHHGCKRTHTFYVEKKKPSLCKKYGSICTHDVGTIEVALDYRLPTLFKKKYGSIWTHNISRDCVVQKPTLFIVLIIGVNKQNLSLDE